MWFKNLRLYTIDLQELQGVLKDDALVEEALLKAKFKPCDAQQLATIGFAPLFVYDDNGEEKPVYHFSTGNDHFFKLVEEAKLLPSSVVKAELDGLTRQKELELKKVLTKEQKAALKAAVVNKLLAQAFATRREILVWVNTENSFVGINVTSAKRAEKALAMLREAFATFPAKLLTPKCLVDERMTSWLKENVKLPEHLKFGQETTLKSKDEDGGVIRASKEDLTSDEISVHLEAGKVVTELSLNFNDDVNFNLTSDLALKKIKLDDIYLEKNLPEKSDNEIADAQALLVIQADILNQLCDYILEIFDCDRA